MDNQNIEQHVKKNISNYLTNSFFQMVEIFQQIVHKTNEQVESLTKNFKGVVYQGNNKQLNIKKVSSLSQGYNKNIGIQLTVLRVLSTKFFTFLLVTEKIQVNNTEQLMCVIIETSDFQAPYNQIWKKGLSPITKLLVKQPYLQTNSSVDIKIVRVVIQNAQIKQQSEFKTDVNSIKQLGNQYFKKLDFINALFYYQYALSCCHQFSDTNTRAILYTNSAASLYKLNLFDNSLKYSAITSRIDRNYYKNYAWKIHCLLQKKLFNQIPNMLVVLQPKANPEDFLKINSKYSIYLSNSLGMYNWYQIAQIRKPNIQVSVSDYLSRFISVRIHESKSVYFALQNIRKHSILVISKPFAFDKKANQNNSNVLCQKITKCFILQQSYSFPLKQLFCTYDFDEASQKYKPMQMNQIQRRIKQNIIKPKDITGNSSDGLGLWSQLTKFSHSCNPNCSVVHFQSIMVVSASTNIRKGQIFTLDFASDVPSNKRKQFLLKKYQIFCKCSVCQLKAWPDLPTKQHLSKINGAFSSLTIIKQFFWNLVTNNGLGNEEKQFIEKLEQIVLSEVSWNDLLIGMKLIRSQNSQKSSKIINKVLVTGLTAHLKIPDSLALKIILALK